MRRFKVHVNGGGHQFVDAKNAFEAAKKASGAKVLKKQPLNRNQPAGYKISIYANDDVTVKVVES